MRKAIPQHIVLPEGDDERVLRAADILLRRGVVDLTILGDADEVRGARGRPRRSTSRRPALVDPAAVAAARALRGRPTTSCASTRA